MKAILEHHVEYGGAGRILINVAVQISETHYAVYRGNGSQVSSYDVNTVATTGKKLDAATGNYLFPQLAKVYQYDETHQEPVMQVPTEASVTELYDNITANLSALTVNSKDDELLLKDAFYKLQQLKKLAGDAVTKQFSNSTHEQNS